MRAIPTLQSLCLRAVGGQTCSAETSFATNQETGEPSQASKLLRTYHQRPVVLLSILDEDEGATTTSQDNDNDDKTSVVSIPMTRAICVGKGCSRRPNANDVDLNHPIVAASYKSNSKDVSDTATATTSEIMLVLEYGNPALDFLQSYIDSLVELGRMDDHRLGLHFFEEWRANVLVAAGKPAPIKKIKKQKVVESDTKGDGGENNDEAPTITDETNNATSDEPPRKRTRRRSSAGTTATEVVPPAAPVSTTTTTTLRMRVKQGPPPPLGALSLNNCALGEDTLEAMRDSGMGLHLGILDLGGIYALNDAMLEQLLPHCPNLQRLCIKNCRRVTVASLQIVAQYQTKLRFLDVGGTYNIAPQQVLDAVVIGTSSTTTTPCPELIEFHASGLGWTDVLVKALIHGKNAAPYGTQQPATTTAAATATANMRPWKAISLGFSYNLSALALRQSLSLVSSSLISLSLHFCETVVDNALMGILGRNLPHVKYLDVRGNNSLNSMTGWYDGRASADFHLKTDYNGDDDDDDDDDAMNDEDAGAAPPQELTVLARFTNITKNSLEDTLRIHPLQASKLTVVLDGGGHGMGIYR